MRHRASYFLAALILIGFVRLGQAGAAHYLSYAPARVELIGSLREQTFPGPPEFRSISGGDAPERQWILHLERPISVRAASSDELNYTVENAREVTLVIPSRYEHLPWKELLNKRVRVTGTLRSAFNAHHHTDLSLIAEGVQRAP